MYIHTHVYIQTHTHSHTYTYTHTHSTHSYATCISAIVHASNMHGCGYLHTSTHTHILNHKLNLFKVKFLGNKRTFSFSPRFSNSNEYFSFEKLSFSLIRSSYFSLYDSNWVWSRFMRSISPRRVSTSERRPLIVDSFSYISLRYTSTRLSMVWFISMSLLDFTSTICVRNESLSL